MSLQPDGTPSPHPEGLTRREAEVVALVAQGLSNAEIAQRLVLEQGTVANHLQHILRKLDVRSRVRVATWAIEQVRAAEQAQVRTVLRRLQQIDAPDLGALLTEVADLVAQTFAADKVDVFLLDRPAQALVALGTSRTPMGQREHALGLDRLRLAQGGRTVEVFRTGQAYLEDDLAGSERDLRAIREDLGVRSSVTLPLTLAGQPQGVLLVCSGEAHRFGERDLKLLRFVARWVSLVAGGFNPRPDA
jgi:DNA-binding CsgD family transcriptional regulator